MGNQWFRFKKFTIQQDKCAMKVGTDGVILGAWTDIADAQTALDIGTGTGLLALMLAQRSSSIHIDAIEIEKEASFQASQNVSKSKYSSQITVLNRDFNIFWKGCNAKYDLIISNPPFFYDSMKPESQGRKHARHTETLSIDQILSSSKEILSPQGRLSIIFPAELVEGAIENAEDCCLFPIRILYIKPTPEKTPKRVCLEFSFNKKDTLLETIVIEDGGRHNYSDEYRELTKDFYLDNSLDA
ncbi:tRNA1(Val) (adenine(37)-N6)-methyltransferase [Bacteroidota bacterium]